MKHKEFAKCIHSSYSLHMPGKLDHDNNRHLFLSFYLSLSHYPSFYIYIFILLSLSSLSFDSVHFFAIGLAFISSSLPLLPFVFLIISLPHSSCYSFCALSVSLTHILYVSLFTSFFFFFIFSLPLYLSFLLSF